MRTKKKALQIYNPRYAEGDMLLENLRSNVLRNSQSIAAPYAEGVVSGRDDTYDLFTTQHPDWTQPDIDDEGNVTISDDISSSWIGNAFSGIVNTLLGDGSFKDRLSNANPADAWRMFHEKRLQAELSAAQTKLEDITNLLGDLDNAEQYFKLVTETNKLSNEYNKGLKNGLPQESLVPILEKMQDNINKMNDFIKLVKTTGKKSDVLVDMFYDTDKLWDSRKALLGAARLNLWVDPNVKGNWYNPITGIDEVGSLIGNVLMSGVNAIGKLLPELIEKSGSYTRRAIKQSLADDDSFDELVNDYRLNPYALKQKIDNHRKYYQRLQKEKEADVMDISRKFKEGTWYFDPSKVSPEYRKLQEENGNSGLIGAFIDPSRWLYNAPELGTSYSDFKDFMGLMASDAAFKVGSKAATKFLSKKANPYVQLALGIGTIASQIGWTAAMRDAETSSEAMDGQSSRVINNTMRNGGDLQKVLDSISTMMAARGYDPDQFTDIEKVLMALAYGFKTGDDVFDEEAKESRKGLAQLINHNNALAFKDYLQGLYYMDYTRSFLRSVGSMISPKARKMGLRELGQKNNIARYRSDTAGDLSARAVLDRHIDNVATKMSADLGRRMAIARTAKWAGHNLLKAIPNASLEGIEEGQQYLTQLRYERGLYDDYSQDVSMFDIPSIFDDAGLGAESIFAYLGILPGDPNNGDQELRRAMNIGAATGGMFHGASALNNLIPSTGKDNVRNLIAQFKNDKVINHIVAQNYGLMEDDAHIGMYFDALSKYGINRTRLQNSLEQLKGVLGKNTSPEYVDRDIDLMNATVDTYNNTLLDPIMSSLHIDRKSAQHKQFVKNAVRKIIDYRNAKEMGDQKSTILQSMIDTLASLHQAGITNTDEFNFGEDDIKAAQLFVQKLLDEAKKRREDQENTWKAVNRIKIEKELRESLGEEADNIDQDRITQEVERRVNESYIKARDAKDSELLQPLDEELFILDQYTAIFGPEYLKQLQVIHDMLTGKKEDLVKLGEETGTDIQLDRLDGMIDSIVRQIREEKLNIKDVQNTKEFEELRSLSFKNQDDISSAIRATILSKAIADALLPSYNVYTVGRANPNDIHQTTSTIQFKDLSKEKQQKEAARIRRQHMGEFENRVELPDNVVEGIYNAELIANKSSNPFADLIKKYNKELSRIESIPKLERNISEYDDLHEIQRETAARYAQRDFDDVTERKRIAHKEWNQDRPLTQDDIDNAQAGNQEARDKVDSEIRKAEQDILRNSTSSDEDWDNMMGLGAPLTGLLLIGVTSGPTTVIKPSPEQKKPEPVLEELPISLGSLGISTAPEDQLLQPIDPGRSVQPGQTPKLETPEPQPDPVDPDTGNSKLGEPEVQPAEENNGLPHVEPTPQFGPNNDSSIFDGLDVFSLDDEINDELLMELVEDGFGSLQLGAIDYEPRSVDEAEKNVQHKNVKKDFIGQTFFYLPKATVPSILKVNGVDINFGKGKKIRSHLELAVKLSVPGWFKNVKKYYIVTGNQTDPKAPGYTLYNPNTYTVALILEEGDNIYATFLRQVDPYVNLGTVPTAATELRKLGVIDSEILRQVEILKLNRDAIIDAYCLKDALGHYIIPGSDGNVINKTVVPVNPRISNGTIENARKNGDPVFRNLTDPDSGFGMSSDTEKLTAQLDGTAQDGITIGMGRGQFATAEEKYKIVPLFQTEKNKDMRIVGKGFAGKLYAMAQAPSGGRIPVVLSEMKFWDHKKADGTVKRILSEEDVELAIDPVSGTIKEGMKPSIGEVIYYLITNQLNAKHLPPYMEDLQSTIAKLIVNYGEKTLLSEKDKSANLPYYIKKQLAFDGINFYVGDISSITKVYQNSILALKEDPLALKKVVFLISRNFHWNTDKQFMRQIFLDNEGDFKFGLFIDALLRVFEKNPSLNEVSIAGLDELTFSKDDFFLKNGRKLQPKAVSVAAWMLKTGKLQTDLTKLMFYAPYVFATGVKKQNASKPAVDIATLAAALIGGNSKVADGVIDLLDAIAADNTLKDAINQRIDAIELRMSNWPHKGTAKRTQAEKEKAIRKAFEIARNALTTSKKEKQEALGFINKELNRESKPYREIFLIDTSEFTKDTDKSIAERNIRNKVKEALRRIHLDVTEDQLDDKLADYTKDSPLDIMNQVLEGTTMLQLRVWDDGGKTKWRIAEVKSDSISDPKSFLPVTGVFSSFRNRGRLNKDKAVEWLHEVLGVDPNRVLVTNGILRGCGDKIVYGAMNASLDELGKATADFTLSTAKGAGRGVHFHEAWHYVNLLLHTEEEREALYRVYLSTHPKLNKPTTKYKDIEEAMAEDFRKYAEMRKGMGIVNKIKRFFNDVLEFIRVTRKKDMLQLVFDSIMAGEYKKANLDMKSYLEFKQRFPDGVNKADFTVDGVRLRDLDKLQGITSYTEFYETGEALAHMMLDQFGFLRSGAIDKKITSQKYKALIRKLKTTQEDASEHQALVIQDIIDNMGVFNNVIREVFGRYGIDIGFRKQKIGRLTQEEKSDDPEYKENAQDGLIWDVDQLKISKKDNVAFKAKLFMSLIVKTRYEYDDLGVRKEVVDTYDILGTPKYVTFDEAWHKIVDKLYDCRYYDKLGEDGYDKQSILGKVAKEAEIDPFFSALLKKLESIDDADVELQNQIYGTIVSLKSKVAYYELKDPVIESWMDDEMLELVDNMMDDYNLHSTNDEIVADRMRDWILQHDTTIRARRNLPRKWGGVLVTSGLVKAQGGVNVIDQNFSNIIILKYNDLKQLLSVDPSILDVHTRTNQVIGSFIELANKMAIPIDKEVVEQYLSNRAGGSVSGMEKYNLLKSSILDTSDGSVGFFVSYISQNIGATELPVGKNKKTLDRIYVGFEKKNKVLPLISDLATAYQLVHPSASEFSMTAPDGSTIYPISQNNNISDLTLRLTTNEDDIIRRLMQSPYARNSILLKKLNDLHRTGRMTADDKLEMNSVVGLKDGNKREGKDYFGITPMEDYIIKMNMTFRDMLVLPTMADKKTYYTLQQSKVQLVHDLLTYEDIVKDGIVKHVGQRFSTNTLGIFEGYFFDELESVIQYYDKKNIEKLVSGEAQLRENYHGNVSNGRMNFSGNGGKFRYMYDIKHYLVGDQTLNINLYLQFLYERQKIEEKNGSAAKYGDNRDGFEAVREELDRIEQEFMDTDTLFDALNDHLIKMVFKEMDKMSKPGSLQILNKVQQEGRIFYTSKAIPAPILSEYKRQFEKTGKYSTINDVYNYGSADPATMDYVLSAMANHTVSSMISIIEFEKIFSGDPAFYKWKNLKQNTLVTFIGEDGNNYTVTVNNIRDAHSDKIKRLGSNLSPGLNLRLDYSDIAAEKYKDADLKNRKYTNLNISDINTSSNHLGYIKHMFTRLAFIDHLYTYKPDIDPNYINSLYSDEKAFDDAWNSLKETDPEAFRKISSTVREQMNPYSIRDIENDDGITVSDAQVVIRPALYRKIRISLGQWTDDDEIAYQIIESGAEWMKDVELSKKVHKLLLYPLKMSYFLNEPYHISEDNPINLPIYNKMAIFPLFKFTAAAESGSQLYERMNREGDEIDMVSFASAVKVGLNKGTYSPYKKNSKEFGAMSSDLNKSSEELGVQIQDLGDIRMQLNTEAHAEFERSAGSQMAKLAFSNVYDDIEYGSNKPWMKKRKGKAIKSDIMKCIKALTQIGAKNIMSEYYNDNGHPNKKAVSLLMQRIATSNNVGQSTVDILSNHGTVSSLMSRMLFELGVNSLVNREVVNINTKGGTAIQQSIFGFTGYNKHDDWHNYSDEYHNYNEGKELNWNEKDGSMEVLLSMNFFKAVVPQAFQSQGYDTMRQWLINHDVIKGVKKSISTFTYNDVEYDDVNTEWDESEVRSNPRPFGIGYRIPTQGMSSIFTFSVADVLPEQSADVIIVPREFTGQTGSDYDVDKIFLATTSYKDGEIETIQDNDNYVNNTAGAIGNQLLYNYMQIVSDIATFADARASIDTITKKIQKELLPILKTSNYDYADGMYCLLPSFLAMRKMEFSTGKDGIGPFALNVTNMALTLFAHLTMRYSNNNEFGFGRLDAITGKDEQRISAWLSAMVNAHVDVAKDPYIFDINVNKATYNHVNFLLRAGMGMSALTYISQPALKQYAQRVTSSGGLYGGNLGDENSQQEAKGKLRILQLIKSEIKVKLELALNSTIFDSQEEYQNWSNAINTILTSPSKAVSPYPLKFSNPWTYVMDEEAGKEALRGVDEDNNPNTLQSLYFNYVALEAFSKIDVYAKELSDLVQLSLVDTKKFGNNIAQHINFRNRYELFKNTTRNVVWYISTDAKDGDNKTINKVRKEKGDNYALREYFSKTFLDQKLYTATDLTKNILRSQSYTATDHFRTIMNTVLRLLYGAKDYLVNGQDKYGYEPVLNTDIIKDVALAIDNIIRFKVLLNSDVITDGIDLNKGGDIVNVYNEYSRLLYGEKEEDTKQFLEQLKESLEEITENDINVYKVHRSKSVFENLADVIDLAKTYPNNEKLAGLADMNGKLLNEMLAFLYPQSATETMPVGRITLAGSQMNVGTDLKSVLRSAFDLLFRSKSLRVRLLANDLAEYAYYSTFDSSTPNSFFDLVPTNRRRLYDIALSQGLNDKDNKELGLILSPKSDSFFEDFRNIDSGMAEEFLETICRNYWWNDKIVPRVKDSTSRIATVEDVLSGKEDNFFGEAHFNTQSIGTQLVHGVIVTSRFKDSKYVTIQKGKETYLYKQVGIIKYKSAVQDSNTGLQVYKLIPKLGVHDGGTHYYEFFGGDQLTSLFKGKNSLDSRFRSANGLSIDATEFGRWLDSLKATTELNEHVYLYFEKSLIINTPITWQESQVNLGSNIQQLYRSTNGFIKFVGGEDHKSSVNYIKRQTNVQITLDNKVPVQDAILKIASQLDDSYKHDKALKIYINVPHTNENDGVVIYKKQLEEYINQQVQLERERIINDSAGAINGRLLDEKVEQFKQNKMSEMMQQFRYNTLYNYTYDIISGLMTQGYIVLQVYSEHSGWYSKSISDAIENLRPYINQISGKSGETGLLRISSIDPMVIVYDKKQYASLTDFSNLKDMYDMRNDGNVLSDKQQQVLADISFLVHEQIQLINKVVDQAEDILAKAAAALKKLLEANPELVALESIGDEELENTEQLSGDPAIKC